MIVQSQEEVGLRHLDRVLAKQSLNDSDVEQQSLLFLLLLTEAAKQASGLSEERQQLVGGLAKYGRVILIGHRFVAGDVTVLDGIYADDILETELVRASHDCILDLWPQQSALNIVLADGK